MGKQKRARQKYHLACAKGRLQEDDVKSQSGKSVVSFKSVPEKMEIGDNIFKDIEIDIEKLSKLTPAEDDRKSVKSISKSIKRSIAESGTTLHLKKKDKRQLRKDLFISKIDAVHRLLHDAKSKKGSKNKGASKDLSELPEENMLFFQSNFKQPKGQKPAPKHRPTPKAQKRKQAMLANLDTFKKLMTDEKLVKDPLGVVTESIQEKVFNEVI